MGILTRLLVFPIAFVLALFVWINGSEAENISCKRLSNVNKVFPTEKMFNDWFPSEIQLEINKWVAVKGKEFLEKVDKKRRFTLYKNGSMRARVLPGQTDIHSGQTFNYKCNSNGFRVAQQNLNIEEIADKEPAKSREQSIVPNGDKQPSQNANQNTVTGLFKKIFTPSDEMLTESEKVITQSVSADTAQNNSSKTHAIDALRCKLQWNRWGQWRQELYFEDLSFFDEANENLSFEGGYKTSFLTHKSGFSNLIKVSGDLTKEGFLNVRVRSTAARYKCNKTSEQVIALIEKAERDKLIAMLRENAPGVSQNASPSQDTASEKSITDEELELERQKRIQLEQQLAALEAKEELETERRQRLELEQRLAAAKAEQQRREAASIDNRPPMITINSAVANGAQGTISGNVKGTTEIAELRVDDRIILIGKDSNFEAMIYVPEGGATADISVIDVAGRSSTMSVRVERSMPQTASISFDKLNPLGRNVASNNDALALVIGVSDYKETNAKAIYADIDAKIFQDYATEKLGVPSNRVKTLVNDGADEKDMLLATKRWLARLSKRGKSDVYIFFAGHGLASDDGSKMYLLPYDGAPELLDDTAILRDRLFSDVAAANPRSVTVFLDTCYSGTTRGTDMLIASRPIAIRALEQSIPDNFTVMTAAAGDQTAKPLEEAEHGMFSYFLMKGMEGEADANSDNEITAGELHSYVQTNVIQQSSGSQTPELQGDADRVLVRFQ